MTRATGFRRTSGRCGCRLGLSGCSLAFVEPRGRALAPGGLCPCRGGRADPAPGSRIAHARRDLQPAPPPAGSRLRLLCDAAERDLVGFASLALYALNVRITADSTYWGLLVVSAVLAVVAAGHGSCLGRPGRGRRAAARPEIPDPDLSDAEASEPGLPPPPGARDAMPSRRRWWQASAFSPAGCTPTSTFRSPLPPATLGWPGRARESTVAITIGSAGTDLSFQIVHRQSDTTTFRVERGVGWVPLHATAGQAAHPEHRSE